MMDGDSEMSQRKQFQLQDIEEIKAFTDVQKQDYISWLKEEIHFEVKRELKFKSLQDDLGLLHKNFKLEQELHLQELENRKL